MSVSISLDLGHTPSVLAALARPEVAARAAKAAAEQYNDALHDWIDAGSAFIPRLGQLQQAINWRPLADGAEVYGTGIPAGHQQWVIRPRELSALRIPVLGGGGFMFRLSVIHKGSQPKPFFFADRDTRQALMNEAARRVVAQVIAEH